MLGIHRVPSGGGSYYLADLATEPGVDPAGRCGEWLGAGAGGLGLAGRVDEEALVAVLSGRRPGADRALAARRGTVGGFDLTFSAPKSVSVLFALGHGEAAAAVEAAHRSAVGAAMAYVGGHALSVRRGSGEDRELLGTGGPVAAAFTHGSSRALDPHLHTHVVLANLAQGSDGRWSAVDGRGLFAHRAAAGSLYEAHLRHHLSAALGVEWEPRRNGKREVAGMSPAVLGAFSNRAAEIRGRLAERAAHPGRARPSARARHVAWAATREPKAARVDWDQVRSRWRDVAGDAGMGEHELGLVTGRRLAPPLGVDERRFAAAVATSPHTGTTRRDVLAAWADALPLGGPAAEVDRSTDWVLGPSGTTGAYPAIGVREPVRPLAGIVPRGYLLGALGPRPVSAEHQRAWRDAADVIDRYRDRWGVTDRSDALGPDAERSRLPASQLADRVRAANRVGEMLRRLGRDRVPSLQRSHRSIGRD